MILMKNLHIRTFSYILSHYMNQCWIIVINQKAMVSQIKINDFEIVWKCLKMSTICPVAFEIESPLIVTGPKHRVSKTVRLTAYSMILHELKA